MGEGIGAGVHSALQVQRGGLEVSEINQGGGVGGVEDPAGDDVYKGTCFGGLEVVDEVGAGFADGPRALADALPGGGCAVVGYADYGDGAWLDVVEGGSRGTGEGVDAGEGGEKVSLVGHGGLLSGGWIIAWEREPSPP